MQTQSLSKTADYRVALLGLFSSADQLVTHNAILSHDSLDLQKLFLQFKAKEALMDGEVLATAFSIVIPILGAVLLVWRNLHQDISSLDNRVSAVEQRIARIEGWLDGWRTPFPQTERQSGTG